ncbi:MAG TPA: hypothetical protein VGO78_10960 [Acidimicrobiales bacterium]|nr:hypothetical protein [Acidimicrobiales bacterium]
MLTWLRPGRPSLRAKVKHPRYLELHRIITESSERDVWRSLVAGDWRGRIGSRIVGRVLDVSDTTVDSLPVLEELEPALPDGVRARLLAVTDRLRAEHAVVVATVDALWVERPADGDRRAFATWASASPYRGLLFARLDGKSWQLDAWSHVRPEAVPLAAG